MNSTNRQTHRKTDTHTHTHTQTRTHTPPGAAKGGAGPFEHEFDRKKDRQTDRHARTREPRKRNRAVKQSGGRARTQMDVRKTLAGTPVTHARDALAGPKGAGNHRVRL